MKRFFFVCVSILLFAGSLYAQTSTAAVGKQSVTVDFAVTMRDLAVAAKTQDDRAIPTNRAIILDGDIGTIIVHEDTATSFVAEVELLNGIWVDETQVELYRTYIICEGLQFRSLFDSQSPSRLKSGQTVMVLATYEGLGMDYDGKTPVPVVQALSIRRIY
ncbi:hypothetical protein [Gracilinema caldarium]|uniref:Uncharacterized protein n=1 Tax=Gracilinema caldarium (strain ATCC 51460 / DSM 7334 / H1) TaxID=744872 RepID=F8EYH1_GRAC1|nr:hypothetical protein [Gracilinema caldarium]AEJ18403.1 hypothetical protein Spica_0235 [Gracilinema caldarium DSM 7334]